MKTWRNVQIVTRDYRGYPNIENNAYVCWRSTAWYYLFLYNSNYRIVRDGVCPYIMTITHGSTTVDFVLQPTLYNDSPWWAAEGSTGYYILFSSNLISLISYGWVIVHTSSLTTPNIWYTSFVYKDKNGTETTYAYGYPYWRSDDFSGYGYTGNATFTPFYGATLNITMEAKLGYVWENNSLLGTYTPVANSLASSLASGNIVIDSQSTEINYNGHIGAMQNL